MIAQHIKPKASRKKSILLILLTLAIILILFLLGWIPRFENEKKIDGIASEDSLPRVQVMQIKPNTKPIEFVLPSSAQAWHITPIWSRVNGYLLRYLVDIGDVVKEGQLLAEIDTPETDEELAQAEADLLNSITERDIAKITSDRWKRLWDKNQEAVPKQEVDQYLANYLSAEAVVIANEKNVARLKYQQQFKYIYAPFEGIITQRNIDIGSLIYGNVNGTAQELFQIAQTHTIRFFVEVPQTFFRQIKVGLEAEISIPEYPGKIFKGLITRFAKALDPAARTLLTEVDVENSDNLIYAGLFGKVKFFLKNEPLNFIIPTTAIIIRSGLPQVAIVDEHQIVTLKKVELGRNYGKKMEIIDGLQEDDLVIIIPSDQIYDGTKVEIIPQNPSQTPHSIYARVL